MLVRIANREDPDQTASSRFIEASLCEIQRIFKDF